MKNFSLSAPLLAVLVFCLLSALSLPALAHGSVARGPGAGLPIMGLSHGEMAVIAGHRAAVIDLAAAATDTTEDFRRILNYARIQHAYCLWGLVPQSISDEESPFNECSHASLAAVKALLLMMRTMPREAAAAADLVSRMESELIERQLSLILCRFSGETFNTADIVRPDWTAIPRHPASLVSLSALLCLLGVGIWSLTPAARRI